VMLLRHAALFCVHICMQACRPAGTM
jgi:hypothetical protein